MVVTIAVLTTTCVTWMFGMMWEATRKPIRDLWSTITIGDTEAIVLERLGQPNKLSIAEEAPVDYYLPGYGRRERVITNRVLVYLRHDLILYVWIDNAGKVEEKFVGST